MSRRGARRLRMALTIFPSLMGQEGSIRASQNICMWMLPLSISIRPSSDRPVYDLRNIRAISPSLEKSGFLPRLLLWLRLVHATANSLSGSWEWIRLSSFFAKLSRQLCKKSNSVKGKVGVISEIFCIFTTFF